MTDLERIQLQRAQEQMDLYPLAAPQPKRARRMECACGCGRWWYWEPAFHRPPKYATDECRAKAWKRKKVDARRSHRAALSAHPGADSQDRAPLAHPFREPSGTSPLTPGVGGNQTEVR